MEVVQTKYNNFKKLCLEIDSGNSWIIWLQTIDLTPFLLSIKAQTHLSNDEIYNEMILKTELNHEVVQPFSEKLKKYFEYFKQIANII